MTTDDARLKKLKLRSWRRGFREADLILGPFADKHVSTFSPEELDAFEDLIEQPDQMLFGWIMGTEAVPAQFDGPMLHRIRVFRDEVYADGYRAD
jgi:antitoxin CptB